MDKKDRYMAYFREIPNFLSVFIFSIYFNIASPILVEISKSTKISTTSLSLIFTFFMIGTIIGQMTSVFFNKKFKKLHIILVCFIILLILTVILYFNSTLILFYILYIFSGYLLGSIFIQVNQYVLESKIKNKERLIIILVSFFPLGAFVAPFISSSIVKIGLNWRFIYCVIILLILINIILYIVILGRKKDNIIIRNEAKLRLKDIFIDKSKNLIFISILLAICFYSCSETIIATWMPTFFRLTRDFTIQTASFMLNLFWLFIIIGRIATLAILKEIESTKLMIVISIFAIISLYTMILVDNKYIIYILIALVGLGYSATFPLLYSAGVTLYKEGTGVLVTMLYVSNNLGKIAAPLITKFTSKISLHFSMSFSFILMIGVTILIFLISIQFNKKLLFPI